MTIQRVAKVVTATTERSGDATFRGHKVEWIADADGDYIEVSRENGSSIVHVLDWDRFQRNYPEFAA
jgi:hypothetical protein